MDTYAPAENVPVRPALPTLRGRDVAVVLATSLVAMLVTAVIGAVLGGLAGGRGGVLLGAALLSSLGIWGGIWFTLAHRRKWTLPDFGFGPSRRSLWHLLWQVPVLMNGSLVAAALLGTALGLTPDSAARQEDISTSLALGPLAVVAVLLLIAVVVPVAEEVLFRRVLLDWLGTRFRPLLAALLSSVAFALVHVAPTAMVYVFFLGLGAAFLRLWHGTLWAPVVLHALNNALVVSLALVALSRG